MAAGKQALQDGRQEWRAALLAAAASNKSPGGRCSSACLLPVLRLSQTHLPRFLTVAATMKDTDGSIKLADSSNYDPGCEWQRFLAMHVCLSQLQPCVLCCVCYIALLR